MPIKVSVALNIMSFLWENLKQMIFFIHKI